MRRFLHRLVDHLVPSRDNAYRPHLLKKPWLIVFLTMVLTAESVFIAGHVLRMSGVDFLAAVLPGEVIAYTNTERTTVSLQGVVENELLSAAAQAKAEDMAVRGYFAHMGPDGKEPWVWIEEAGYQYRYAGENLAVRFTESRDVVEAWMASPSHRANIIKDAYTEIGVGVAEGLYEGRPATYVVQYFGTPAPPPALTVGVSVAQAQTLEEEITEESIPVAEVQGVTTATPAPTLVPAVAQGSGSIQNYTRVVAEGLMKSDGAALWLIGGIAALIIVTLLFTFFMHVQVQPNDMLMGGATVAVIAITLFVVNTQVPPSLWREEDQTAAIGALVSTPQGIIDVEAASTQVL